MSRGHAAVVGLKWALTEGQNKNTLRGRYNGLPLMRGKGRLRAFFKGFANGWLVRARCGGGIVTISDTT